MQFFSHPLSCFENTGSDGIIKGFAQRQGIFPCAFRSDGCLPAVMDGGSYDTGGVREITDPGGTEAYGQENHGIVRGERNLSVPSFYGMV